MSAPAIARRRLRLAVIVAVASGVVAAGVTGLGLLVPSGEPSSAIRVVGAFVALGAGAVLVRLDGPARGATTLALVGVTAAMVCLVTLPVSPVTLPGAGSPTTDAAPGGGDGAEGGDVTVEEGGGAGTPGADPVTLPEGADVVVEGGEVVLTGPEGGRLVIGQATLDGADPGTVPGGALVVVDGVVTWEGGVAVDGDAPLGGTTFERSDGSAVTVGDDAFLEVPEALPAEPTTEPLDAVLALLLGLFAVLAFAPPLVRFGERLPVSLVDDPADDPVVATPTPVTMEEGLAEVLRAMLSDPDPRTSVIGAYARLLTAMEEAGHPRRPEEGPHEHLWRTLGPLGVRRQPVHRLAELFVRARFTPRPVTEDDRHAAIGALADAVADLRLQAADVREAVERVGAA